MSDECLFCKISKGEIPSKKVYEDEKVFAFHDISPQAPTHILIIPKEHIPTLNELEDKHGEIMGHAVRIASKLAKDKGFAESGYRLVANCQRGAGQSVFHIHFHLLGGRDFKWPPG